MIVLKKIKGLNKVIALRDMDSFGTLKVTLWCAEKSQVFTYDEGSHNDIWCLKNLKKLAKAHGFL